MAEPVALATTAELGRWMEEDFSDGDDSSTQRAEDVLLMASEWARAIAGKLWATAEDAPTTVVGIVLASARREMENPRRVTYEVKGPESASYNQANYPPGFFTEAEYKFLRKFRKTGGLWTLGTYRDTEEQTLGYLYAGDTTKPLPWSAPGDPGWEESVHL